MNFTIKCQYCKWREITTGYSKDLTHLKEIVNPCSNCGKPRKFVCPKCKRGATMKRDL